MRSGDRGPSWADEVRSIGRSSLLARGVDVECPRCASRAEVRTSDGERRLTCLACGFANSTSSPLAWPDGTEPDVRERCFGARLWLQAPCLGHVLWAVNDDHLDYIERYVQAVHRRDRDSRTLFNSALGEQFPRWMVLAKHRPAIVKTVGELRRRLQDPHDGCG